MDGILVNSTTQPEQATMQRLHIEKDEQMVERTWGWTPVHRRFSSPLQIALDSFRPLCNDCTLRADKMSSNRQTQR
jgi:hypothetical protein